MTICKLTEPNEEGLTKPTGSPAVEKVQAFYKELAQQAGVITPAQQLELGLQADFVSSVASLSSAVVNPGRYNKIESYMASFLGWKRWIWQGIKDSTNAGAIRQDLFERSRTAGHMIRMLAQNKALPAIHESLAILKAEVGDSIPATRIHELLHDQIVIGNMHKLQNVSDSPIMLATLNKRYLDFKRALSESGISSQAQEQLEKLGLQISSTYDELRAVAGKAGMDIDRMENGGYFPIQATEEFKKVVGQQNEAWQGGFKSLQADLQKARKTNLPVVADVDFLAARLQKQLLGKEISEQGWEELSQKELDVVLEQGKQWKETLDKALSDNGEKLLKDIKEAGAKNEKELKKKLASVGKEQEAKIKGSLSTLKKDLQGQGYPPSEVKAIVADESARLYQAKERVLEEARMKSDAALERRMVQLRDSSLKAEDEIAQKLFNKQNKRVKSLINHEKAKIALMEMASTPGEFSKFLSSNFTDAQMKRMFEAGYLQQMPLLTDELLEFYRGMDLGVRGLADAIILDPVQALKNYAKELSDSVEEQNLFKTAFDMGADAGWVKAVVDPSEAASYIRVGNSAKMQAYIGKYAKDISDLYIHRTAADQLNSLIKINSSPHLLQQFSNMWGQVTSTLKKGYLLGRNTAYLAGVFTQNVIATYAATGSLTQISMAFADAMNFGMKNQWDFGDPSKVFKIGNSEYSVSELFREVMVRRGSSTAESLGDPRGAFFDAKGGWAKAARERSRHFNSLFGRKWNDPIVGAYERVEGAYNKAYSSLALMNGILDNTFRWATVRELAVSGRFDNLEDLMRYTDNYFAINGDGGTLGNALSNVYMPFAQFAINAPGAAIRHAIANPWRAVNVMQLYASAAQTDLSEAELPSYLQQSSQYFFTTYVDPETGKRGVIMPSNVDFMLSSYDWFKTLALDLSGSPKGAMSYIDDKRNRDNAIQRFVGDIVSKSYFGDAAITALGFDPRTMRQFDPDAPTDTLLGIPMTRGTRSLLTRTIPILRSLDQSLPTAIVGRAPQSTRLETGYKLSDDPGQPGIFGATPTSGGTRMREEGSTFSNILSGLTGITVQDIDPQDNVLRTYSDLSRQLSEVKSARNKLNRQIMQGGGTKEAIEQEENLARLSTILLHYKVTVDNLAEEKGYSRPSAMQALKTSVDSIFSKPLQYDTELRLMREYYGQD
jgi:hypothetical protein